MDIDKAVALYAEGAKLNDAKAKEKLLDAINSVEFKE